MVADNPRFPSPEPLDDNEITSIPGPMLSNNSIDFEALSEKASNIMEKIDKMTYIQLDNRYHDRQTKLPARVLCENKQTPKGEHVVFLTLANGVETLRTLPQQTFHKKYSKDLYSSNNITIGDIYWNKETSKQVRVICTDRITIDSIHTVIFLQKEYDDMESTRYTSIDNFLNNFSTEKLSWPPVEGQEVWYIDLLGNTHSIEFDSDLMNLNYIYKTKNLATNEALNRIHRNASC